jgi:hypothetical protein
MWENIFIQVPNKKLHVFCWARKRSSYGNVKIIITISSTSIISTITTTTTTTASIT